VENVQSQRLVLQETMNFLGAITSGIEEAVGNPANSISYVAGEKLGRRFSGNAKKTEFIAEALEELRRVLQESKCLWHFESFKPKACAELIKQTAEGEEIMLVFRDCMIRQSLFKFGHHQKGSLCNMMNGFFAAALQGIMGRKSRLEIIHAGENACYKKLTIQK
jgi:predicted hydrocarbon binding protein